MFNLKEFEDGVYALVTQGVNQAFSELLKGDETRVQSQGIQLHRAIQKVLHGITEEVSVQILCGLVMDVRARLGKK